MPRLLPSIHHALRGLLVSSLIAAGPAFAGDFNEEGGGIGIKGYDPVAYVSESRPTQGSEAYAYTYKGSKFLFASASNRDAFAKEPDRYAPQFGGYCAYGTAGGYKVDTQPDAFSVIDGKLYLNYNTHVRKLWNVDRAEKIQQAEANWPEVSKSAVRR